MTATPQETIRRSITSTEADTPSERIVNPVNVLWFGAAADYVPSTGAGTDDTAAIQRALALISVGRGVFLPAGNYKISDDLTIPNVSGFSITGEPGTVIWQTVAGKGIFKTTGTSTTLYGVTLRGITALCASAPAPIVGGVAFDLVDVSDSSITGITVASNNGNDGFATCIRVAHVHASGGYRNDFFGCRVRSYTNAAGRGVLIDSDANANFFFGGQIQADLGISLEVKGEQANCFGVVFEGTATKAILLNNSGTQSFSTFFGNRFEGMTTAAVDANSKTNVTFLGNSFTSGIPAVVLNPGEFSHYQTNEASATNGFDFETISRGNLLLNNGNVQVKGASGDGADTAFQTMRSADGTRAWVLSALGLHFYDASGTQRFLLSLVNSDGTVRPSTGRIAFGVNGAYIGADNTSPRTLSGSGTPEGSVSAPVGSTYSRTDGGAVTSFYVKEAGTGNTGWVGK